MAPEKKAICRWGHGRYLSPPDAADCKNPKDGKRELCSKHQPLYAAAAKAKRATTQPPKPATKPAKPRKPTTMESEMAAVKEMRTKKSATNGGDVTPPPPKTNGPEPSFVMLVEPKDDDTEGTDE